MSYKNKKVVDDYIKQFNPYENHIMIGIDLVELTRYAKRQGKKLSELSENEISLFRNK